MRAPVGSEPTRTRAEGARVGRAGLCLCELLFYVCFGVFGRDRESDIDRQNIYQRVTLFDDRFTQWSIDRSRMLANPSELSCVPAPLGMHQTSS